MKMHQGPTKTHKNCAGFYLNGGKLYLNGLELKGVDLKSFFCIQDEYSKDKNHVYFGTTVAADADPKTFKVLANGYAKDKKRVYIDYYSGKTIDGADPASFKIFADMAFSKDKQHVYQQYEIGLIKIIEEADAASFEKLANTTCYRDKKHLFNISGEILLDITTINPKELSSYCGF